MYIMNINKDIIYLYYTYIINIIFFTRFS